MELETQRYRDRRGRDVWTQKQKEATTQTERQRKTHRQRPKQNEDRESTQEQKHVGVEGLGERAGQRGNKPAGGAPCGAGAVERQEVREREHERPEKK